ncbi:RTA1 like protein-domain-containing protein [Suillus clintonianus]|uniref:RTA1 like protein-domain-containing protein n=1 Tax=Suillus clintonianus TaxID=1904413 RepID=UPI001B86DBFE|nr:RTA1 like protein-domain-containing protein [Suillus clintonianus]KAG2118474.1 RTA1 like protein-domain-containing protein [Suillus clintonianus]
MAAFLISAVRAASDNSTISVDEPTIVSVVFQYSPSKVAAAVAGGLYFIASLCLFMRLFMNKAWWGLCLPIASTFMSVGFFMRIPMAMYPNSLPIFMVQQLFTLLPPAAYLAFNYILYGRFIVNCVDRRYSWIKPEKVARYFVISDITTFLIQGGGGGLEASTNVTSNKLGANILLAGLVIQTLSFVFFMLLIVHAWRSILRDGIMPRQEPWGPILWILMFSSTAYLIRCIYRVIELAQGSGGYLITHEIYFYLLDSLPLLIGISTYIIYWPTKYLESSAKTANQMSNRF